MPEKRLLLEQLLAAYREIVPDHSVSGEFLVRKLSAALFARGGRVTIGETLIPPEQVIHHSLDAEHRVVWTDKLWHRVLGYRPHYAIGRSILEFLAPDSQRFLQEVSWPAVLRDGKVGPITFTFVTAQGELLPASGKGEALRDEGGAFLRTFAKIRVRLPLLHPMLQVVGCAVLLVLA